MTGSSGKLNPKAPGLEKAIAGFANDLPFENESADLILSSWLLFAWIHDPAMLAPIFAEFHRLLKPGGRVMIYPHSKWHERDVAPKLTDMMRKFEISQRFLFSPIPTAQLAPAYVTTFTKR
jgi:SAM-dependent methyltransferase